nr:helix-turn-helix domain-containing protein [uncultured Schaedlerella sp.]
MDQKPKESADLTLDKICDVLDCQPGDILEYQRDESNESG